MTTPITSLLAVTIDTPDASRLARFYADLTGGEVTGEYPEYGYAEMTYGDAVFNFQGVADYVRPQWPGQQQPQQFHLDFRVADMPAGIAHALALGATRAEPQPEEGDWTVMIDPDGHPFCLCPTRD